MENNKVKLTKEEKQARKQQRQEDKAARKQQKQEEKQARKQQRQERKIQRQAERLERKDSKVCNKLNDKLEKEIFSDVPNKGEAGVERIEKMISKYERAKELKERYVYEENKDLVYKQTLQNLDYKLNALNEALYAIKESSKYSDVFWSNVNK